MGGHRQRTVLKEPAHTHHTRPGPTQGARPRSRWTDPHTTHPTHANTPHKQLPHGTARAHTNTQLTTDLSHNHLLTHFFTILREVATKWFT